VTENTFRTADQMSDAKENVFELAVDKLREALNYELACDGARRILRNVFVPRLALVHRRMFGTPYTELTVELLETQCRRYAIALGISNPQRQPEPVLSNEQLQRALLNLPVTTWIYYHVSAFIYFHIHAYTSTSTHVHPHMHCTLEEMKSCVGHVTVISASEVVRHPRFMGAFDP
jgi:hypothetical protein